MTMLVAKLAVLAIVAGLQITRLQARHTMSGRRFVVALPGLATKPAEICFYLSTLSYEWIEVMVSTPLIPKGTPLFRIFSINEYSPHLYLLEEQYYPYVETGTTFTYKFDGEDHFGLNVYLVHSNRSGDTFQALPVEQWDRVYYVSTIMNKPFVLVISADGPNLVRVKLNQLREELVYTWDYYTYRGEEEFEIQLKQYEAFSLAACKSMPLNDHNSLTGTKLEGHLPIGVISGNCWGYTNFLRCNDLSPADVSNSRDDFAVEMLMPTSMYGTEFITVSPVGRRSPGIIHIYAPMETKVLIHQRYNETYSVTLEAGSIREINSEYGFTSLLTSTNPVQILFIQRSHCAFNNKDEDELGDPSMTLLIPTVLFYDTYIWSDTLSDVIDTVLYMGLVADMDSLSSILVNEYHLPNLVWDAVVGTKSWKAGWVQLVGGEYIVHSLTNSSFGCYFCGLSNRTSYMHTGGFISEKVNGSWGNWNEWRCITNCNEAIRRRLCDNPAPAHGGEDCPGPRADFRKGCEKNCIRGVPNTFGSKFLMALPSVYTTVEKLFFVLCTGRIDTVLVNISSVWYKAIGPEALSVKQNITRNKPATISLDFTYFSDTETGKKFTYLFQGDHLFTITTYIWFTKWSVASFVALPIDTWGRKYFVFTLSRAPFVQIATEQGPNYIELAVKTTDPISLSNTYEGNVIQNGQLIRIYLEPYQGFSVAQCLGVQEGKGDLTGTKIEADFPIGVVTGNCKGHTETLSCYNIRKVTETENVDAAAEMQIPVEMYGKDFITISPAKRVSPGQIVILASEAQTTVSVARRGVSKIRSFTLTYAGDIRTMNISARRVTSDKAIMVLVVQRSPCTSTPGHTLEIGDASISMIVPTTLFMDTYLWSPIQLPDLGPSQYVAIVSDLRNTEFLIYDGYEIDYATWEKVLGLKNWLTTTIQVMRGPHILRSGIGVTFGCYIYGMGPLYGYMHSAGFLAARINAGCNSSRESMETGDLIDNDCDGKIDEEFLNFKDDDGDSRVDEDLMINRTVDGDWGPWTEWLCGCKHQFRYRQCDNPMPLRGGYNCGVRNKEVRDSTECDGTCSNPTETPELIGDGGWAPWQIWHCGHDYTENREVRKRSCTNPPQKLGGKDCFGYTEDFRPGLCRKYWTEHLDREITYDIAVGSSHSWLWMIYGFMVVSVAIYCLIVKKKASLIAGAGD